MIQLASRAYSSFLITRNFPSTHTSFSFTTAFTLVGIPSYKLFLNKNSLSTSTCLRRNFLHSTAVTMTQTIYATDRPLPEHLPHRLEPGLVASGPGDDWIRPLLSGPLEQAAAFRPPAAVHAHPPRILVLHGTLRERGFSKLLSYECARILEGLGADVRVFDPNGLPVRDPTLQEHPKVLELRELVYWSEAQVWSASELHGNLCSVFKNQIDWIPLNSGSVRPTQGKAVAVLQVCGGSQSFNVVNTLRLLARWMRMPCVVNQSSVQKAWKEFDDDGRMKESSMRERVVDVMEEFIKYTRINREFSDILNDRYSERKEKEDEGRLLTQAEKEAALEAVKAAAIKEKANE